MKAVKVLLLVASVMVTDFAFAQTWTPTGAPSESWYSLASSADGSKIIAAFSSWQFGFSTNGGATWTTNNQPVYDSNVEFRTIALSADGTEIVCVAGPACWVSTDLGNTWSSNNVPGVTFLASVAMSADGSKLVVVAGQGNQPGKPNPGPICISTNRGTTWTQTMAPTNNWVSVASSADGSKLVAAVENQSGSTYVPYGDFIYISTNSGASWILSEAPTNIPWGAVASSADGSKVVAGSQMAFVGSGPTGYTNGLVYTSTDFGMTWVSNNVPQAQWYGVASSSDGTHLAAVGSMGTIVIYSSTNAGTTWVSNNVPNQLWNDVVSTADGIKLLAASEASQSYSAPGYIYTFQTTPTPQLNVASLVNNLELSWLIPSTNFVVQQSSDLISWSSITDAPALNLTNLNNELSVSPTNSSGFFRLSTP